MKLVMVMAVMVERMVSSAVSGCFGFWLKTFEALVGDKVFFRQISFLKIWSINVFELYLYGEKVNVRLGNPNVGLAHNPNHSRENYPHNHWRCKKDKWCHEKIQDLKLKSWRTGGSGERICYYYFGIMKLIEIIQSKYHSKDMPFCSFAIFLKNNKMRKFPPKLSPIHQSIPTMSVGKILNIN